MFRLFNFYDKQTKTKMVFQREPIFCKQTGSFQEVFLCVSVPAHVPRSRVSTVHTVLS